jgi:hypothetical protein
VVTIYILVPLMLIPQILFCGVLVKFDKLHKSLTNYEYVPVIGDLMASRWAYEALTVEQFKKNKYQKIYYDIDREVSNATYPQAYLIPVLKDKLNEIQEYLMDDSNPEKLELNFKILHDQILKFTQMVPDISFNTDLYLDPESFNDSVADVTRYYFSELDLIFRHNITQSKRSKNEIEKALIQEKGGIDAYTEFRNRYDNVRLTELVVNRDMIQKVVQREDNLIRKHEPIYQDPGSRYGRAHLYAPYKMLAWLKIDTLWFNMLVIWVYGFFLYLALYFDLLRKLLTKIETIKFKKRRSS